MFRTAAHRPGLMVSGNPQETIWYDCSNDMRQLKGVAFMNVMFPLKSVIGDMLCDTVALQIENEISQIYMKQQTVRKKGYEIQRPSCFTLTALQEHAGGTPM